MTALGFLMLVAGATVLVRPDLIPFIPPGVLILLAAWCTAGGAAIFACGAADRDHIRRLK